MRKMIKTLGAAVIAVLAIGSFGAQGAAGHEFTSDNITTYLTGEGTAKFTIQGFSFSCGTTKFVSTQAGETSDHIRLVPTYSNYTAATCSTGSTEVAIHTAGCSFTVDSDTDVNEHARVEVVCEAGNEITITAGGCVLHIPPQIPAGGVSFLNEGKSPPTDVKITWTVGGFTAIATHTLGCTLAGKTGHLTEGVYTETTTIQGYRDGSSHQPHNQAAICVE